MNSYNLISVPVGNCAKIHSLCAKGAARRRLLDLGFTPGSSVSCLYEAPSGNPKAYLVRDTVIALRAEDAKFINLCTNNN